MSGRRRRSESLWDTKEEALPPAEISGNIPSPGKELHSSFCEDSSPKWLNSGANDVLMSDDISGQFSWEPSQGNGNMPKDDDISRDKHRMQTDPDFDEQENQFSARPSDDCHGMPYRGRDRGIGDTGNMSRDRDRSRSRSRSPKRSRGNTRGMARSRSRSRGRDRGRAWENSRARSRSPSRDDRRESYEYADVKNDSRVSSRPCKDFAAGNCRRGSQCRFFHQEILNSRDGGNRLDNDSTERSGRPQYSGGLRHGDNRNSADVSRNRFSDDYDRGDRNVYDDQDRRRQSRRTSGVPCKFFAVGKCNRNDCKFSHDVPESGGYDGRSHDNIRDPNLGSKNKTWNDRQPRDDSGASGFPDFPKSDRNFDDKNKSWNGPKWDDMESGGFEERSRDDFQGHSVDDRIRTRDRPSGSSAVAKARHNSDDKKKSWEGPSWDEVNASDFPDDGKSNHNFDSKKKPWDGVNASGFSDIPNPSHNYEDKNKSWNGNSRDKINASGFSNDAKSNKNIDRKRKSGYADAVGSRGQDVGMLQPDSKSKKWDAPEWNEQASEGAVMTGNVIMDGQKPQLITDGSRSQTLDVQPLHIMPEVSGSRFVNTTTAVSCPQQHQRQEENNVAMVIDDSDAQNVDMVSGDPNQQILTYGKDFIQSVHSIGSQLPSNVYETAQSRMFNGSVQSMFMRLDSQKKTQNQINEGGKPLEASEIGVPQGTYAVNATVANSEQVPQGSSLPTSLPQTSQAGQLAQAYSELNLTNALGLLCSLPISASSGPPIDPMAVQQNLDVSSREQYESARNTEANKSVKTSAPMDMTVGQENQTPVERFYPTSMGDPNFRKLGAIGAPGEEHGRSSKTKKQEPEEHGKSSKTKKQEPVRNPEGNGSIVAENPKDKQENINPGNSEAQGKVEEVNISSDEKAMRLFKIALVEFVKEILKPTWKEGKMSREDHKTIVKKVVDKVTSTIQGIQIPRTQERIDQYLAFSKSKITKLVEAYVERSIKA